MVRWKTNTDAFDNSTVSNSSRSLLSFQSSSTACAYAVVLRWQMQYIFSEQTSYLP